ncbi:unnamed protein product [Spirodela intermedia]|uniref:Uncharacterized protein n=1 Tax=Spirodela intermedia TaxID=51605 RepID=A0A7I8IEE4_SPIIN|nr:unnamed protein product [Spirodela intermedia]CAA6656167.1 unnamed protein product [Spirodela intermedia]
MATVPRRFTSCINLSLCLLVLLHAAAEYDLRRNPRTQQQNGECVYTVYVRTGSVIKGGTDSKIGFTLGDATGRAVVVEDLEAWGGLMGPGHDYYERGNLDVFSGRGPAASRRRCAASTSPPTDRALTTAGTASTWR